MLCKHCGLAEWEHHEFVPAGPSDIPAGCMCDQGTWDGVDVMPPICDAYDGNGVQYCGTCEHDAACHKTALVTKR